MISATSLPGRSPAPAEWGTQALAASFVGCEVLFPMVCTVFCVFVYMCPRVWYMHMCTYVSRWRPEEGIRAFSIVLCLAFFRQSPTEPGTHSFSARLTTQ